MDFWWDTVFCLHSRVSYPCLAIFPIEVSQQCEKHGRKYRENRRGVERESLHLSPNSQASSSPQIEGGHYGLARLYRHEYGQLAMKEFGMLASVVEHKEIFFREAAARYDLAQARKPSGMPSGRSALRRFGATTSTCGRCSLLKLHRSIP